MDIYIKPVKKASIAERKSIYIKDIAEVFASENLAKRVKNIKLLEIKDKNDSQENKKIKKKNYLVTIIDIISAIDKTLPGHTINNVGEIDTIIEYSTEEKKDSKLIKVLKIIFVVVILAGGSSTAIMSFHSDAQMATVFENYYYIFFNEKVENPILINLPYSLGLAVGIIVFFNHFSGKKITEDPTPIEVEMSVYESEVTDNIIDTLNTERIREDGEK